MRPVSWRSVLLRRLGWSLGPASVWTWGLLLLRIPRDGFPPLEVWFSYSLSFLMTAVYVYLGLLIYAAARAESDATKESRRAGESGSERAAGRFAQAAVRFYRPMCLLGWLGLSIAVISLAGWLTLRYPGPQAIPGTYASLILALMIVGVTVVSTLIARGSDR